MKTKLLIYPFCGCFLTSAAVALTLFGDKGYCGYDVCLNNPGPNTCCAPENRVTRLNIPKTSASKITGGFYMTAGNGEDVIVVTPDGQFDRYGMKLVLQTNGEKTAKKREYDSGTIFTTFTYDANGYPSGTVVRSEQPPRGNACDEVEISLVECTGYSQTYQGQTIWDGDSQYACVHPTTRKIYYKTGLGYFSTPDYNPAHQYKDATHPNAPLTLTPPNQLDGYTFRGYFPSWWSRTITGTSSYIGPWTPYRTEEDAFYISWKDHNMDELYIVKPTWVVSSNIVSGATCGRISMFAGWAKNCEDPNHCELRVTGHDDEETRCIEKTGICGSWYRGAVEYMWKGNACADDEYGVGTTSITHGYPYGGENPTVITQTLNTYQLGCQQQTLSAGDTVNIDYNENWSSSGAPFQCESVLNSTCSWNSPFEITSAEPACHTAGTNDGKYQFNSWVYANGTYVNSSSVNFACNATYVGTPTWNNGWTATGVKSFACLKKPGGSHVADSTLDASQARYCKYTVQCAENYHCANNNCTKTCRDGSGDSQYSSCTNFNLNNVCVEEQITEFTCPTTGSIAGVSVTGGNMSSSNGICTYTASCSDATKTCTSNIMGTSGLERVNLCQSQTCSGLENCQALVALYTASSISCTGGEPGPDYSGVIHLEM
ncbi:MAG: hypothetical protein J6T57_03975 [Alphaproteobacteria bacterium]|nr:hypothetical protein [Alphaproteobacteria bacterium]